MGERMSPVRYPNRKYSGGSPDSGMIINSYFSRAKPHWAQGLVWTGRLSWFSSWRSVRLSPLLSSLLLFPSLRQHSSYRLYRRPSSFILIIFFSLFPYLFPGRSMGLVH